MRQRVIWTIVALLAAPWSALIGVAVFALPALLFWPPVVAGLGVMAVAAVAISYLVLLFGGIPIHVIFSVTGVNWIWPYTIAGVTGGLLFGIVEFGLVAAIEYHTAWIMLLMICVGAAVATTFGIVSNWPWRQLRD